MSELRLGPRFFAKQKTIDLVTASSLCSVAYHFILLLIIIIIVDFSTIRIVAVVQIIR